MKNGTNVMISSENDENPPRKWWQNRSKRQRKGIWCLLGILIGLTLILLVYFCVLWEKPVTCISTECHDTALEILGYIDEKQNPCDDFYKFACGGFLTNISYNDPLSMQSVRMIMGESIQSDLRDMLEEPTDPEPDGDPPSFSLAKKFYKACMDEQAIETRGLEKLRSIFKLIGGWPVLEGENWRSDNFNWSKAVRSLRASGLNFDFFFNVSVEIDRNNPDRYILGIHDPVFGSSEISPNSKVAFMDYMVDVVSEFNPRSTNLKKELNDVMDFLLRLAEISEISKNTNNTNLYDPHTISELQTNFKIIPQWYDFLQGVLGSEVILNHQDIVSVSEPVYIKQLARELYNTNKRVLANFMGWKIVQKLVNYLPSTVLNKAYKYLKNVNGEFSRQPRWSVCVEATRNRFSPAINLAYVERYFDDDIRSNVTDLIKNVKIQFKKNILMSDWLDEETKRKIVKMLLSSVEKIYSDNDALEIINENSVYDSVKIDEQQFLKAVLDLDLILLDQYYSLLRKPVKDDWVKSQTFINGFTVTYSPNENKLKFPLGLFRGIYYNKFRPDYMNYGLLGSILAHQISHLIVNAVGINVGESKAAEARLINLWSPYSYQKYTDKIECLSKQYAKFKLKELDNIRANSYKTRDEDLADLSGFKVAYDTFLEREWIKGGDPLLPGLQYSPRQLFWISSALQFCSKYSVEYLKDKYSGNRYTHSPNEFRVNGPLQNLKQFSDDFGCNYASYMNPVDKCYIW